MIKSKRFKMRKYFMDIDQVKKLLERYSIYNLDELEYYLSIGQESGDECRDDDLVEEKNCINAKCYEDTSVPDCRKVIEIYNKYFKDDIKNKKSFIDYLEKYTETQRSSIENYLSCKSCNQQMKKAINQSLKISNLEFKKDFCSNLDKKFNYNKLFGMEHRSVTQFLAIEHQKTEDNFIPEYEKERDTMTKEEKEKLFNLTVVSKDILRNNLAQSANLEGSTGYRMNLALAAFDRNLIDECSRIIDKLSAEGGLNRDQSFLQLKAKVLSGQRKDKEAIVLLRTLIEMSKPEIDTETHNLLAASIKRSAFEEYRLYGDEEMLKQELTESKDIYYSIYKLNNDFYPALNYMYLESMLMYVNGVETSYRDEKREVFDLIWSRLNHQVNDWWSYIANVEFLVIMGRYEFALSSLKESFDDTEELVINDFNVLSTIRQLELYAKFCSDSQLKEIISFLEAVDPESKKR
jgi:hypothetical protein